jgi:acetyl esterase/lipase
MRIGNWMLRLVYNIGWRPGFSPRWLRGYFRLLARVPRKRMQRKFPNLHYADVGHLGIPVERVDAHAEAKRIILYLHGGGYFMGSPAEYRPFTAKLAYLAEASVFVPDYRLAPEHPFPAALDDAEKCYRDLLRTYPAQKIVVAGDSAGGGLTLALLLRLLQGQVPLPACAVSLSPWADLTGSFPSVKTNRGRDVWLTERHIHAWSGWYAEDKRNPLVSPVFGDFAGACPLLVAVGDQEVLRDEALAVAQRAKAGGVRVTELLGRGLHHDWMIAIPYAPESKIALRQIVEFLAQHAR